MTFADDKRDLFIAGKLRFPADPAKTGSVMVVAEDGPVRNIVIFTEVYGSYSIERRVLAAEVAAIFLPNDGAIDPCRVDWPMKGRWFAGSELSPSNPGKCSPPSDACRVTPADSCPAIMYLAEHVSVVNTVIFGSSAVDSHVYRICDSETEICCNPCRCSKP